MEKTIFIDGRDVRFKASAAFLIRYKAQFRRDALKDLLKLEPILTKMEKRLKAATEEEKNAIAIDTYNEMDLNLFYDICWVLAKTADKAIPEPEEWLDTFSTFPVMDITEKLMDILTASIEVSKKK